MNNLNSVLIEGNLTRDPELSYTSSGTPLCKLAMAVNRYFKRGDEREEEVSFFDVTVWQKQAEACGEHLEKGQQVRVTGRLQQDRWQDNDGGKRSRVVIVAERVDFGRKAEGRQRPQAEAPAVTDDIPF